MIGIIGARTTIANEFRELAGDSAINTQLEDMPFDLTRYLICMGYLAGEQVGDLTDDQAAMTWEKNFLGIVRFCDQAFDFNPHARICIIGSRSGEAGSYDMAYAGAKAAIHMYIRCKRLTEPGQQLVGIAPTIIEDSGMTQMRDDLEDCMARGQLQRRGRWLRAIDVARLAHFLLYVDDGAISNQVIIMDGGQI